MIFPAASHEGRFYLIGYRPMDKVASIAGYGRVSVGDGRLEILNTSKAMQDTLPKIAGALMAGKFQFLASSKVDEIVHNRPAAHCTGEPNTTP
jgi:hypothetical protein